jgi:hypothetical protein
MISKEYYLALSLFFCGLANSAYADYDDPSRALIMQCDYADDKTFQSESISISSQTSTLDTQSASVKAFKRGIKQKTVKPFLIKAEQFAECVYPSGNRVRVKVGEGGERPFGECGADPDVFMSVWVNKRKIASRVRFSGRCWDTIGRESHSVSFKISSYEKSVPSIQKCHTAMQQEKIASSAHKNGKQTKSKPLSVCVDFPNISNFPRDFIEYPRKGVKLPKAGDILLLKGSDKVCKMVHNGLKENFWTFEHYSTGVKIKLLRPNWSSTSVKLPEDLHGSEESSFDFDNDGKLDRVFLRTFTSGYMYGSVLLVQHGHSASELKVSTTPMDKNSSFLPCQMDSVPRKIMDCPPFPDSKGEGDFLVKGRTTKESVHFRGRYTTLTPFNFQNTSFIGVSSISEDDYTAVLKPLPNKKFQQMCLFQRVAENF